MEYAVAETFLLVGGLLWGGAQLLNNDSLKCEYAPWKKDEHTSVPADGWLPQYRAFVYDLNFRPTFDEHGMIHGFTQRTGAAQNNFNPFWRKLHGTDDLHRRMPTSLNPYLRYRAKQQLDEAKYWKNEETTQLWQRVANRLETC